MLSSANLMPIHASDDYVTGLARLLQDTLHPGAAIYIEYSNEVWNTAFSQCRYNQLAAEAEVRAGGSPFNNDGTTLPGVWAQRRHANMFIYFTLQSAYSRWGMWGLTEDITDLAGRTLSAPPVPLWVQAVAGDREVRLEWAACYGAAHYVVQRATGDGPYAPIATVQATTFTDRDLDDPTTWGIMLFAPVSGALWASLDGARGPPPRMGAESNVKSADEG